MAWTKSLAASHDFCTRLAAEATVRKLRAACQHRSAAERLPPEIWGLIRNQLVFQTVEDVEGDLLRQAALCPTCQANSARTSGALTLRDFLNCTDCMEWNYDADLDLRWARDGHEQATRTLLGKFGLEETALPLICQSSDASFDTNATCPIVLSREQERTAGMICANVWGNLSDPDRGQVRRIEPDLFRLPADAAARFARLFRMLPSLRAVDPPPHTPTPALTTGGGSNTSSSAGPSTADTSAGGERKRAAPYRPDEPRWILLSGYCN